MGADCKQISVLLHKKLIGVRQFAQQLEVSNSAVPILILEIRMDMIVSLELMIH